MDESDALRPIVTEAIDKFRFGSAALALRRISQVSEANAAFVKHLADIYDNLHILWLSPENDFHDIRRFTFPISYGLRPSEVEQRYFEQDSERFRSALQRLEHGASWEAAGNLLKCYYCLSNGSNLGALVLFGRALRLLQDSDWPYPNADRLLSDIEKCASASVSTEVERINPGVGFSFYTEYDNLRTWIRNHAAIDIYALQKDVSPRFRYGAS